MQVILLPDVPGLTQGADLAIGQAGLNVGEQARVVLVLARQSRRRDLDELSELGQEMQVEAV